MSAFRQSIAIAATESGPFEEIEALVDTGSPYTWAPRPLLERLGVRPVERAEFERADGRVVQMEVGVAIIRIDGRTFPNVVVFGGEDASPILGVVTLETFRLAVDPVRRQLVPVRGLAMATPYIRRE